MTDHIITKAVIGWHREDGEFDVIAAVNCDQFEDDEGRVDNTALAALLATIKAIHPNGRDIVAIERHEIPDVLDLCRDDEDFTPADFEMNVVTIQSNFAKA